MLDYVAVDEKSGSEWHGTAHLDERIGGLHRAGSVSPINYIIWCSMASQSGKMLVDSRWFARTEHVDRRGTRWYVSSELLDSISRFGVDNITEQSAAVRCLI